jgi:hypothetical protein
MMNTEILKDILACAECRFQEVLRAMRTANPQYKKWMETALFEEVVSKSSSASFCDEL